jgi:uncharacterized membrane protein HdeD (DUF308 family)
VYLFAAFILLTGIIDLVLGVGHLFSNDRSGWHRLLSLLVSLLEIGVGVYLFRHPHVAFTTFVLLIGIVLIVAGVVEAVAGLFEEGSATYRTLAVMGGVLAVIAGVWMLFQQEKAGVAFVWILGVYALITGPLSIALAMDVNRVARVGNGRRSR